ncbi:YchJ family protein [uncultured Ferrimonas sp.]|uniref:YchJ family protein n=1 Tax=uncultured Ferrimonas sp. TaxID=432640 RepID=UPI002634E2E8|nr:YchJ family protein [uncultured Ferrimonas sp.]
MSHCPCGSKQAYADCCQPLHQQQRPAQSPQQLMASRYCAFVKGEAAYLLRTHHPEFRGQLTEAELAQACQETQWHALQIVDFSQQQDQGEVEFCAWYKQHGKLQALHERSRFSCEQGLWYYRDGDIKPNPALPGRNDPCLCGSGNKFKRCCG